MGICQVVWQDIAEWDDKFDRKICGVSPLQVAVFDPGLFILWHAKEEGCSEFDKELQMLLHGFHSFVWTDLHGCCH